MSSKKKTNKRKFNASEQQITKNKKQRQLPVVDIIRLTDEEAKKCPKIKPNKQLLKNFVYPLDEETFMKKYIDTNTCFAVLNAPVERFASFIEKYFHDLNLSALLHDTSANSIHIWMKSIKNDEKLHSFEIDDPETAELLYNAGASLYFTAPEETEDIFVNQMSQCIGMNFASIYTDTGKRMGEIEVFVSRKGHTTDWHFDFMHNFTFQLKGKKKWKLARSTITHPIRGWTPHYLNIDTTEQQLKLHQNQDPDFNEKVLPPESYEEVELTEGSVFYHPPGIFHRVECTEDSISINISLIAKRYCDVVLDGVKQLLWKKDDWRAHIIGCNDVTTTRQKFEKLLQNLKDEVNKLKVEDLIPESLILPRREEIDMDEEVEQSQSDLKITEDSKFRKNPLASLVELEKMEDKYIFVLNICFGNEIVSSSVRVSFAASKKLAKIIRKIQSQKEEFLVKDLGEKMKRVSKVLNILKFNGYIQFVE